MNGFEAYGIMLAIVMTDPATIGAAGRLWARLWAIGGHTPSPVKGLRGLWRGGTREGDLRQKRIGSNGVQTGGKGANL